MVPDAMYEEGVGRILSQVGLQADGASTAEGVGWRMGLTLNGGCDGGGGFSGGGYLRLPPP